MDTKETIVQKYIRILQSAFACFYGKDNVSFSIEDDKENNDPFKQHAFAFDLVDEDLEIDIKVRCSFVHRSKLFESFLFERFYDKLSENNVSSISNTEIENFGRRIYQDACRCFEKHMRKFFHIHIENIIEISSDYYEGAEAEGNIYFYLDDVGELPIIIEDEQVSSKTPFCKAKIKTIRKMLEICRSNASGAPFAMAFSFDEEWRLEGFVKDVPKDKHHIRFHFVKHMVWDMYWDSELILRYSCGEYIDPEKNYENIFKRKLQNIVFDCALEAIWKLVEAARLQRHGTILVIMCEDEDTVRSEVSRLLEVSSGTMMKSTVLTDEYVSRLTTVDGALIIDHKGKGYGYGMILISRGSSKVKRDSGRGARFNSAKLYIADQLESGKKAIAVIVSADGMVSFYSTDDATKEEEDADRQ